MKIRRLRVENLASFERFEVDFCKAPLKGAGLFAIVGATGSGKSTLLDAISIALFHKVPRLSQVSKSAASFDTIDGNMAQSSIAQLVRKGARSCLCEVEFEAKDGKKYIAQWGYKLGSRSNSVPNEFQSISQISSPDHLLLANSKKDVPQRIESILGMDFSQFTKTVLLAQGSFAAFLKAETDERSKILEALTGEDIYSRISIKIHEQQATAKGELEKHRAFMSAIQQSLKSDEEVQGVKKLLGEQELSAQSITLANEKLEQQVFQGNEWIRQADKLLQVQQNSQKLEQSLNIAKEQQVQVLELLQKQKQLEDNSALDLQKAQQLEIIITEESSRYKQLAQEQKKHGEQLQAQQRQQKDRLHQIATLTQQNQELRKFQEQHQSLETIQTVWQQAQMSLENSHRLQNQLHELLPNLQRKSKAAIPLKEQLKVWEEQGFTTRGSLVKWEERHQSLWEHLEWNAQLQKNSQAQAQWQKEMLEVQGALPMLRQQLLQAQQQLDLSTKVVDHAVVALRATLHNDEACPVCGSLEHPWSHAVPPEFALLHQSLAGEVQRLSQEIRGGEKRETQIAMQLQQSHEKAKEWQAQLSKLPAPDFRNPQEQESQYLQNQVQAIKAALVAWDQLAEIQEALIPLQENQKFIEQELHKNLSFVENLLGEFSWQEAWKQQGLSWVKGMEKSVADWQQRVAQIQRNEHELQTRTQESQSQVQNLQGLEQALQQVTSQFEDCAKQLMEAQGARAELFGGDSLEVVRQKWEATRKGFEARLREVEIAQNTHQGQLQELQRQQKEFEHSLALLQSQIALEQEMTVPTWLQIQQTQLQQNKEELKAILESKGKNQQLLEEQERLQNSLQADLIKTKELEEKFRLYADLNNLVGSSDGKKFRLIAQQMTLDTLVQSANTHLQQIEPRYTLKRQTQTLEIGVLDAEHSHSLRPIHTLSGGESFICSLSLALALSDFHGAQNSLGTLFIDEGFGTLDPQTLQQVLKALERLHQQGRQVGLVTHVEEMKAQIPVRIEVRSRPHQASTLVVV